MRSILSTLLCLMALSVPLPADDDDDRWEGRRHRRHRERIVVVQPPCRHTCDDDRWERRRHRRPEVVYVTPAPRRAPWLEPRLEVGLPLGSRGHIVMKLR